MNEIEFIEWVELIHHQNLSGREDFIQAFRLGIEAAYEEREKLTVIQSSLLLNNSFKKYDKVNYCDLKCRILIIDLEKGIANIQNDLTKNIYTKIPLSDLTKIVL